MKKILILVFILGVFLHVKAQDNKNASKQLQEAEKLNLQVVKLFQQNKFDEALPLAKKVVEIRENELGKTNLEVAKALTNLGFIEYFLKNNKEAEKTFEDAVEILDKQAALSKEDNLLTADVLERLALIKYELKKPESAENLFEKALAALEKAGEKDSLKASRILFSLANLSSAKADYNKASSYFEQSLAIKVKKSGEKNSDALDAFDSFACASKKADKEKDIQRIQATYFPTAKLTEDASLTWSDDKSKEDSKDTKSNNVVNGKALSLPKPVYPVEARQARADGTVKVKVKINEQGNVVYACGAFNDVHKSLIEAAEFAAYNAKFQPTLLSGKPVKVTGVIVYNFIKP